MTHLDDTQLIDALDGESSHAHLRACGACRDRLEDLRRVLAQVTAVPSTEPSPLFWEHFVSRVTQELDRPLAGTGPAGRLGFRWLTGAISVVTIALLVVTFTVVRHVDPRPPAEADPAWVSLEEPGAMDEDQTWALVRSVANDLDYDSAHDAGIAPAPGSLDRAAVELSPVEQSALVQLIAEAMKRTDS